MRESPELVPRDKAAKKTIKKDGFKREIPVRIGWDKKRERNRKENRKYIQIVDSEAAVRFRIENFDQTDDGLFFAG